MVKTEMWQSIISIYFFPSSKQLMNTNEANIKVVLYPKFDEMCGFRKITKRGLLNVLKRIHVTFSIAIHSKSRYSANSASG